MICTNLDLGNMTSCICPNITGLSYQARITPLCPWGNLSNSVACQTAINGPFFCTPSLGSGSSCGQKTLDCPIYRTMEKEIIDLTNKQRREYNLLAVSPNRILTRFAQYKAMDMAINYSLGIPFYGCNNQSLCPTGHENAKGDLTGQIMRKAGITEFDCRTDCQQGCCEWGENLAYQNLPWDSACQFMAQWNMDCGHLKNILEREFSQIGVAIVWAYDHTGKNPLAFALQEFGK